MVEKKKNMLDFSEVKISQCTEQLRILTDTKG